MDLDLNLKTFPDYSRPNGILRHSKLFGPGKNLPHIWQRANRRRRSQKNENEHGAQDLSELLEDDDDFRIRFHDSPAPEEPKDIQEEEQVKHHHQTLDYHTSDHNYHYNNNNNYDFPLAIEEVEIETEEIDTKENEAIASVTVSVSDAEKPRIQIDPPGSDSQCVDTQTSETPKKCKFTSYETYNLWRHGPAEYWYDLVGLPSDEPTHFDYGFKLKEPELEFFDEDSSDSEGEKPLQTPSQPKKHPFPDECFEMVTQLHWEDDIILDKDDPDFKESISKSKMQTWEPVKPNRNSSMTPQQKYFTTLSKTQFTPITSKRHHRDGDPWYSIFPVDTEDLLKYPWEKDIIWDPRKMDEIPVPKILELDPNDDNIIICPPDEPVPQKLLPMKTKINLPHLKKSKILLGNAGLIKIVEDVKPELPIKPDDKDPYNISNDEFYQPKRTRSNLKLVGNLNNIQHPIPVLELRQPYIPTHLNPSKLLTLHRPALRVYKGGSNQFPGPHAVFSLTKRIEKKAKLREQEILNVGTGAGNEFLIRVADDLSGKDGEILLIEYSEQYPPLLSMIGMASKIKNYYKRKADKDNEPVGKYGETVISHTSPFLGVMHPGQLIQAIENNLYRAPIYQHDRKLTDFLILRTRNNFYIRTFDAVFTAAQECPLYEVPRPNSRKNNEFIRDSILVYIYRMFWDSTDTPRKIRMEDIKKAFPAFNETVIRKKLKLCADFFRTGPDQHQWVIKPEFRLPTEEELRQMITPEHYCAYFSMLAAEQRLCSAGYVNQYVPGGGEDDDIDYKVDDEVKTAPWNTTRAFVQAMKGKCIMQIEGAADPTGCGEGFSYVRVPNKPMNNSDDKDRENKKTLTGTDADLRKLSLPNAKAILRKYNVPEAEIQKLSRWEVIDVVRTLSTEKARAEGGGRADLKYSRLKGFSTAEHHEKYREDCQRIFDLQNQVLFSKEELSTDEEVSEEEEEIEPAEDLETLGKNIEHILMARKTTSQIEFEKEEIERLELRKMIHGDDDKKKNGDDDSEINELKLHPDRVLKIERRYKYEGREFTRSEIVRNPKVIDIYMRIRKTKDDKWIKQFAETAASKKEQILLKRRQLAQLRKANKPNGTSIKNTPAYKIKKKAENFKPNAKVTCSACGEIGHMKSNKLCKEYSYEPEVPEEAPVPSVNVAMTEEQEKRQFNEELKGDKEVGLVKVDGIKLRISGIVLKQADEIKRQTLILKVPREYTSLRKRKRLSEQQPDTDYFEGKARGVHRRRIDPQIILSNIFEMIIDELRADKATSISFLVPVSHKIPKYYEVITRPIDLRTMRDKNKDNLYKSRDEFIADMKLMLDNARLFNGDQHIITAHAQKLYETAQQRLIENEEKISILEKEINQLLENGSSVVPRPRRLI